MSTDSGPTVPCSATTPGTAASDTAASDTAASGAAAQETATRDTAAPDESPSQGGKATLHVAELGDIPPRTLYEILRLRVDAFVVEQEAAYADLDGLDSAPGTELHWAQREDQVLATLRLLRGATLQIGRVVAAPAARGTGIAAEIMDRAMRRCTELEPGAPVILNAQEPLTGWYARFGFEPSGERYLEDGIAHIPMTAWPS